ncbi:MAG: winged helix-turn-helix domain-containing protein [Halieaceae bacterium]|nr:winged helix-turn-helix domain-containing protein [Halieaceae bacterium]
MRRPRRFGNWQFCPDTLTLTTDGHSQHLEPRVAQLLVYFLDHPEELLSHDRLVESVWEGRVVSDEAVRRAISNLRQALTVNGAPSPIRTVHKGGYIAEFPSAPPEEPRENLPAGDGPAPRPGGGHSRARVTAALLLAVVLVPGLLFWLLYPTADPPVSDSQDSAVRTIAVLPFSTTDTDADAGYLSEGLADELLNLLVRIPSFQVTARSSSFLFRDRTADPREIGRQLDVRYLVEGTVQHEGGKVRIMANLVDTRSGFQLWSQRYDRTLADLFAVQEDIAAQIARELQVALVSADGNTQQSHRPVSLAAHMAYLEGRRAMNSGIVADLERAIGLFEQAIELDPRYALAMAQLAKVLTVYPQNAPVDDVEREALLARAGALLDRALVLDPGLGIAYIHRSGLHSNTEEVVADLRRGLALHPSYAAGYEALAEELYFHQGKQEEGLVLIDKARELDPLRPRTHHLKAYMMIDQCRYDEAEALERQALRADPRFRSAYAQLGALKLYRGDLAQAALYVERALRLDPEAGWLRARLARIYLDLDDLPAAVALNDPQNLDISLRLMLFNGKLEQAAATLMSSEEVETQQIEDWWMLDILLQGAAASGRYLPAREFMARHQGFNKLESRIPSDEQTPYRLYRALLDSGPDLSTRELGEIAGLRDQLAETLRAAPACRLTDMPRHLATADMFLGNYDGALRVLQLAAADGSVPPSFWWSARVHPAFIPLQDNAEFQALLARQKHHAVTQRERLQELRRKDSRLSG